MITKKSNVSCAACEYHGPVLEAHHGYKWWMLPLMFALACSGIGLIPLAIIVMLIGNRTYFACPSCKGKQLEEWIGEPKPEDRNAWEEAVAADKRAFARNKYILLAVVLTLLAVVLIAMTFVEWY